MIHNKFYRHDDKNQDVNLLRNRFKEEFSSADFRNNFSYNLVIYDDNKPVCLGRLEMKSGLFVIVGLGVDEIQQADKIRDLAVRLLIRKAADSGAQGVYVKLSGHAEAEIDFYKSFGFQLANKNFHEEFTYYRHGDISGDCSPEKANEKKR